MIYTLKVFYFLFGLLFFVCYFFRGPYFKYVLNINESKFGVFAAISSLLGVYINLIVAYFADKWKIHTALLILLSILSSGVFTLILIYHDHFAIHQMQATLTMGAYVLLASAMWPLVDYIVLDTLACLNYSRDYFSSQRLYGNVGYFVVTLGIGHIITVLGYTKGLLIGISIICPVFVMYVVIWKTLLLKPNRPNTSYNVVGKVTKRLDKAIFPDNFPSRPSSLKSLLSLSVYKMYLISLLIDGFIRFFLGFFLNIYFTAEAGMSPRQAAATVSFGILVEMCFYAIGSTLLRVLGVYPMFALGQLVMSFRLWGLFLTPSSTRYEFFVLIELVRGVIGGLIHPASVAFASHLSPVGSESFCQSLFNCIYTGLGGFFAGMIGSFGLSYFKEHPIAPLGSPFQTMLFFVAISSTLWSIIFIWTYKYWIIQSLKKTSKTQA